MKVGANGELELAWYVFLGTALYLAILWQRYNRGGEKPTAGELAVTFICAGLGYAGALELLTFAAGREGGWRILTQFPNFFGGFAGFVSHNIPKLFDLAYDVAKRRAVK